MEKRDFAAVMGALAAAFFFGVSTPLCKVLSFDLDAFTLAGLLYLGAGLGLAALEPFNKRKPAPPGRKFNLKYIAGMIVFGGLLGPVLLMLAIKIAPATSVSIWLNMELVATALLGALLFNDRLYKLGWTSVALTLGAGLLLTRVGGVNSLAGGLLTALACVCWGFDNHFTALIDDISPSQSTIVKGLAAGSTNLLIGAAFSGGFPAAAVAGKALLVGFACYGLSIALYISAAQKLGAVRSQLIFSVSPLFGVLLSVLWLGEPLTALQVISGVLLFGSVLLMMSEKHGHRHRHEALEHTHQHVHDDRHHGHVHEGAPGPHSHFHKHEPGEHEHQHLPDLHHRHGHGT